MANFVKEKIAVSIFSILVLFVVTLLEANFYRPSAINRWRELDWNDFQAIPKPFGRYAAEVFSNIYLEYDSITSKYSAFAGQDNMRSWVRSHDHRSDNLLKHEQYHFNISEYHARLLNSIIDKNPGKDLNFYQKRLDSVRQLMNKMQAEYDYETDHNLKVDMQSMWEYRIDSLLAFGSGWVTDSLSGGRVFFPHNPSSQKGFSDEMVYRIYSLKRYYMNFSMTSFQGLFSTSNVLDTVVESHSRMLFKHISTKYCKGDGESEYAIVISRDSSGHKRYVRWQYLNNVLFNVSAQLPINISDTTGYDRIVRSFLSSFQIIDTDSNWHQLQVFPERFAIRPNSTSDNAEMKTCFVLSETKKWGLTRGPIFREDGSMVIAFDPIRHNRSDIDHYLICRSINKRLIYYGMSYKPMFYMTKHEIPKDPFWVDFGYFLKEDSVNDCARFYRESILVDGINKRVLERAMD